jgi:hypothetical protein
LSRSVSITGIAGGRGEEFEEFKEFKEFKEFRSSGVQAVLDYNLRSAPWPAPSTDH